MLHRVKEIISCAVTTSDGDIGHVRDILFDDHTWSIRYFVIQTGAWFDTQQVLLSPEALDPTYVNQELQFTTKLTRSQVKQSPPLMSDQPISRKYEDCLHSHYDWSPYWSAPIYSGMGIYSFPFAGSRGVFSFGDDDGVPQEIRKALNETVDKGDNHLRSFNEVKGYAIDAIDGKVGHLADALIDSRFWRLSHFVIDTHNWLPDNDVVVDVGLVQSIDWPKNAIAVELSRNEVKDSPPYDPARTIDDNYQIAVSSYYHKLSHGRSPSV